MAAPTLQKEQIRKSLRKKIIIHNKPKTHLLNPYSYAWPVLDELVVVDVVEKITDLFKSLPLRKQKLTWKERQKKQALQMVKTEQSEDEKKRNDLKSQLVVGVNAVTRSLEKDELSLFIVCRSAKPTLITKHLVPLAACRKCPALCIPQFSDSVGPLLGFKSAIAVGFKKLPSEDSEFREFICYGQKCAIPIDMPWAEHSSLSKNTSQVSVLDGDKNISVDTKEVKTELHPTEKSFNSSPTVKQDTASMSQLSRFIPKDDYSYLYVFKSDKNKYKDWGDFVSLGHNSESSDSDNYAYRHKMRKNSRETDSISQPTSSKRKQDADENEVGDSLKIFQNVQYKPTILGQQFKNPNKRRKKPGK